MLASSLVETPEENTSEMASSARGQVVPGESHLLLTQLSLDHGVRQVSPST